VPEYNKESLRNTIVVAVTLCLVCSVIVSTAAVVLKPMQKENQLLDRKQNVLRAAGVLPAGANSTRRAVRWTNCSASSTRVW